MASPLALLDAWPAEPCAAAVLVGGELVDDRGAVGAALQWASVTKLATALATLVAVERGRLHLDSRAGPPGSTVRHLLAHASGIDVFTRSVRAPPGRRRIYSNAGYEVLAEAVAAAVGTPFERWLGETVLSPLGMTATTLAGSSAAGLVGPLADLVGLAGELQRPTLLSGGMARVMTSVAFGSLAGVLPGLGYHDPNEWGLGPEVRGRKSPHWTGPASSPATFGHFGAAGGFVWVDPRAGVACACLTGAPFGAWARAAWPPLADAVLASYGA